MATKNFSWSSAFSILLCTQNITKLAHIRMKFGGIMQTVGNER